MNSIINKILQKGKYLVLEELKSDSFSILYKGVNQISKEVVSIETIDTNLLLPSDLNDLKKQFLNKARKLVKCCHPKIIKFREFFTESGLPYIVKEYITGSTLDSIVMPDRPISEAIAVDYIRQVGEALKVIHSNGFLHLGIKPQNLLLCKENQEVRLKNFGIDREFLSQKTKELLITSEYAAIEQERPEAILTPATDIYSLAATLYTLLTGRVPLEADLRVRYVNILRSPKDIQSELSENVSEAIMRGMELEAHKRPASVDEWLSLLPHTSHKNSLDLQTVETDILEDPPTDELENIAITDEFLQPIREELTRQIGPVGGYIIDNILEDNPQITPEQLLECMADEINKFHNLILNGECLQDVGEELNKENEVDLPFDVVLPSSEEIKSELHEHVSEARPIPKKDSLVVQEVEMEIFKETPTKELENIALTDDFLQEVREEIIKQIGPIGSYIIDNILEENPQITAEQFLECMTDKINKSYNIVLTEGFLQEVREEITKQIGPIGGHIIDNILEENPQITPKQLVKLMEAKIGKSQKDWKFQHNLP
ncbi:MAG: serine/threonine-protein kinase [Prochloraceae cyanobacterium]|nr:serine/threonine-protein kinase [Prochloraceae cyanobacterium]